MAIRPQIREDVIARTFCDSHRRTHCRQALASNRSRHQIPLTIRLQLRPHAEHPTIRQLGDARLVDVRDAGARHIRHRLQLSLRIQRRQLQRVRIVLMLNENHDGLPLGVHTHRREILLSIRLVQFRKRQGCCQIQLRYLPPLAAVLVLLPFHLRSGVRWSHFLALHQGQRQGKRRKSDGGDKRSSKFHRTLTGGRRGSFCQSAQATEDTDILRQF